MSNPDGEKRDSETGETDVQDDPKVASSRADHGDGGSYVGRTGSEFDMTTAEVAGLGTGFSQIVIGRDGGSHTMVVGDAAFKSPMRLHRARGPRFQHLLPSTTEASKDRSISSTTRSTTSFTRRTSRAVSGAW